MFVYVKKRVVFGTPENTTVCPKIMVLLREGGLVNS